jgi:hypothetical protein
MLSAQQLAIESNLASAHFRVLRAAHLAEGFTDQGLADDCHQLAEELRRLIEDLVSNKKRPRHPPT